MCIVIIKICKKPDILNKNEYDKNKIPQIKF